MAELLATTTLTTVTCCACGILFALPQLTEQELRRSHEWFYCPMGHRQHFPGKSREEKLADDLAREKHRLEQTEARLRDQRSETERVTRRLNATRGVVTRHKKKIAADKCPCCSMKFKDLAKHMQSKHPKWDPTKEAEVRADG